MTRRAYDLPTEKEIAKAYLAGGTTYDLANRFGGTNRSIANALERQGVTRRNGGNPAGWFGTKEQEREVLRLYASGMNVPAVARAMKTRTTPISEVLARAGVTRPGGKSSQKFTDEQCKAVASEYETGASLKALASKHGCTTPTIALALERAGARARGTGKPKFWTAERERHVVHQYVTLKLSQEEIAKELGVSQTAVSTVLRREGIRSPKMSRESHHAWQGGRRVDDNRGNNEPDNLQLRFGKHGKGVALQCRSCGSHDVQPVPLA